MPLIRIEGFVDLEKEFEENVLNSAVYLISVGMQISNFAVNYKVSLCTCTHSHVHDDSAHTAFHTPPHTCSHMGVIVTSYYAAVLRVIHSWSAW